jgi:transcriptional regulator with PAS, ATPase and Fis domain
VEFTFTGNGEQRVSRQKRSGGHVCFAPGDGVLSIGHSVVKFSGGFMQRKILFLATYKQQVDIVKQLSEEIMCPVDVFLGGIMRGGHIYAYENQDKYDVFVMYGAGAAYLRNMLSKPVISPYLSFKYILSTYFRAAKLGYPVTIFAHNDTTLNDFKIISSYLPEVKCNFLLYNSIEEYNKTLEIILEYNNCTLIAIGDCVYERINKSKKINYMIFEDVNGIEYSLLEAKSIITMQENERLKTEKINGIIQNSIEGIIILDKLSTITTVNKRAGDLTGMLCESLVGRNILDPSLPKILREIFEDGATVANKRMVLGDGVFLVNRVNILMDNENVETIICFHNVPPQRFLPNNNSKSSWENLGFVARHTFDDIVGRSPAIRNVIGHAQKFSVTEAPILVEGETGTGKELFVQSIHNASPRRKNPFVAVNCAALPETLLESELFGYEEGAFTGARRGGKKGLLEMANTGTIFLDEISASSLNIQSRLLRVLQEKEMMRVGGTRILRVDIRVIAATNRNLRALVGSGAFRDDLYFRLRHLKLSIPPLRDRRGDIMPLVLHFLSKQNYPFGLKIIQTARKLAELIQWYPWPGNVRELEHFIENLAVLCDASTDVLKLADELLGESRLEAQEGCGDASGNGKILLPVCGMKEMQKEILHQVLAHCKGDKKKTADLLQISRVTLWKMLKESLSANNYGPMKQKKTGDSASRQPLPSGRGQSTRLPPSGAESSGGRSRMPDVD